VYRWPTNRIRESEKATEQTEYLYIMEDPDSGRQHEGKIVVGGFPDNSAISRYDGIVSIDTSSTNVGVDFPVGTESAPVNNLTDARKIADARILRKFNIRGSLTGGHFYLPQQAYDGFLFSADDNAVIDLNGQSFNQAVFLGLDIKGDAAGSSFKTVGGRILGVQNVNLTRCITTGFKGRTRLFPGEHIFDRCFSGEAGADATAIFDLKEPGVHEIGLRSWPGGVEFYNSTNDENRISIDEVAGQVILGGSNTATAGTKIFTLRGVGRFINTGIDESIVEREGYIGLGSVATDTFVEGVVYVGETSGTVGTDFPIGTLSNPCQNVTDAISIANFRNISQIRIIEGGSYNIDDGVTIPDGFIIKANDPRSISLNIKSSNIVNSCTFDSIAMSGNFEFLT
jgi:hypothetical protein